MQALRRVSCTARPLASTLRSTSSMSTPATSQRLTSAFSQAASSSFINSSSFSTSASAAATIAAHGGEAAKVSSGSGSGVMGGESIIPISNIQAQWESMTEEERSLVHEQLEDLQTKDWRGLSLDEKRAAYYVAFGPHGSRVPATKPGEANKVVLGVLAVIGATGIFWGVLRTYAHEPPRTMTKEWQEASNEKALEQKQNPITGVASEGYKGKGHVQSK